MKPRFTTHVRLSAFAALLVVSLLLAALGRVDDPACYRVRSRAAAPRHSLLTRQAGHGGDSPWYPEPLRNVDLVFFRTAELPISVVRLILRGHRSAFGPVPIRRLKLPPSHNDPF